MQIKVSKVFAKFINETAKENGLRFKATIELIKPKFYTFYTGSYPCYEDFDFKAERFKTLCISYPADYYANEVYLSTDQIINEFRKRNIKTLEDLKQMILDLFEI